MSRDSNEAREVIARDAEVNRMDAERRPILKPYGDIPRMASIAESMVKDSLDAFLRGDCDLAQQVIERDDEVDQLNHQIFRELLSYMAEDPHKISTGTRILFVSKYLERIADHATNIAEMVVFMVKGKTIRHMDKSKK